MAKYLVFDTLAQARKAQRVIMTLAGLPSKGTNVRNGHHVTIESNPADLGARSISGWTTRLVDFVTHPVDGRLAVRVTPALQAFYQANKDQLTEAQLTFIQSHLATQADLTADWERDAGDGTPVIQENTEVVPE